MKRILLFLMLFVMMCGRSQQLQSITYQNWEAADWQDWFRQEIIYDNGNVSAYLYQVWDEATLSWKNSSQTIVLYDMGQPSVFESQNWDAATNSWTNVSRIVYEYTTFGKVQKIYYASWDGTWWHGESRTEFTYNAAQFLTLESHLIWDYSVPTYVSDTQTLYTNDGNGNPTEIIFQQYDGANWINMQKTIQTFNANLLLTSIVQTWTGSAWINATKSNYSYDASDYLFFALFQDWQTDNNSWVDGEHHNYTNNADGTISEFISQQWNGLTWTNFQRAVYVYETLGIAENEKTGFAFYPNPTKDYVEVSVSENAPAQMTVVDANGKIVRTLPLSGKNTTVDVRDLSNGTYLLNLQQQGKTQTKKFIKK